MVVDNQHIKKEVVYKNEDEKGLADDSNHSNHQND
jgi:hypothetical protein